MLSLLRCSRAWRLARPLQLTVGVCAPVRPRAVVCVDRFSSTWSGNSVAGGDGNKDVRKAHGSPSWAKKVVAAVKAYKEVHGDTVVPRSFVVPTGDARWPREARGYRLGEAVNHLRVDLKAGELSAETVAELEQLRFVTDVSQYRWEEVITPALRHFHKLHAHIDVPFHFVVPTGDASWPRPSWGLKMGYVVNNIRSSKRYGEQMEKLKEELKIFAERDWNERLLLSLKVFRDEFHHCIVEVTFKVPARLPWPEKAWGMRLGGAVHSIRKGRSYVEQTTRDRGLLDEIGFAWDRDLSVYNECIFPSLEVYAAQRGSCHMNQKFVVPKCAPWPRAAWGTCVGRQLYKFKCSGAFFAIIGRDVERLEKVGFSFELSGLVWQAKVAPLLDTYESSFGDRHVPQDFVIPAEAPWPKKMWGVWLGYIVARNAHLL